MGRATWASSDAQRLIELRVAGMSASQIAASMGRTRNAVCGKLERMAADGVMVPPSTYVSQGGWRLREPPPPKPKPMTAADQWRFDNWERARDGAREALANGKA